MTRFKGNATAAFEVPQGRGSDDAWSGLLPIQIEHANEMGTSELH
jgi:hypothetical protein